MKITLVFKPYGEDQNTIWKVTKVMESYPDWVKVLVVRMNQVDIDKLQFFGFSESGFAKPLMSGVFLKMNEQSIYIEIWNYLTELFNCPRDSGFAKQFTTSRKLHCHDLVAIHSRLRPITIHKRKWRIYNSDIKALYDAVEFLR